MRSLFSRTKSRRETRDHPDCTKNIARERLQRAITRDRNDLAGSDVMEALRRDVLAAISRHLDVGDNFHEFEIQSLNQSLLLVASIRVKGMVGRWATVG